MPSHYYSHHIVVAAVLWLLCAAATGTGVGPLPPSPQPPSSDNNECRRRCGDVHIPYPFGAGPADSCSASPELRLHCNHTGNGVRKLFLGDWQEDWGSIEVLGIDVIQGQMQVVSRPIFYSCFINHNTTSEGSLRDYYYLPEPYRFSSASNKFTVLGCLTSTYMLGSAFEDDSFDDQSRYMAGCVAYCRGNGISSLKTKHPTNGSCTATIQGDDEGLRYYYARFENVVNGTNFITTYPCAYALLMDSSYRFNFSTSYLLAPSNEFNKSWVPVVLDWVIRNNTCPAAHAQQPAGGAGYACVSDHSKCVNASGGRGYLCRCAEGFQGNPYVKQGCKAQPQNFTIKNKFNKSRVPVVLEWDWVIPNQTCRDAHTQSAGYPCISNHSICVDANGGRGYFCQCAKGFQDDPYAKEGCKDDCMDVEEPYRFSAASNKFTVLECLTVTYMLGFAVDDARLYMAGCVADCHGNSSLKQQQHPTNGSCTGMGCCRATFQGDEGLRYYNTKFDTTYPCADAVLMDSSYGFNFSTSYLAPNNKFNKSRVPVVVDWEWPAGYACISDHSKCVDTSQESGYLCQCAMGFQGNPYVKKGCEGNVPGYPSQEGKAVNWVGNCSSKT
ncbi:hypothetical protein U9M48_000906 [Paspalum notatum var. saurae]|uniref:EGF-like domain-containing protein n=1 Tax=Paspalum notatum var. saurae TaxID=547442 RepID=A0AAQ3SIH4_PASNO